MNKIIGALWHREKDGKEYFSGVINDLLGEVNIAIFPNNLKSAENQPKGAFFKIISQKMKL